MNPNTLLYDLPDDAVDLCGGELYAAMQAAGYDITPRNLINDWNCWGRSVGWFLAQLTAP